jgi:hypothetical protein
MYLCAVLLKKINGGVHDLEATAPERSAGWIQHPV